MWIIGLLCTCYIHNLVHVQETPYYLGSSYCPDEVLQCRYPLPYYNIHLQFYVYNNSQLAS